MPSARATVRVLIACTLLAGGCAGAKRPTASPPPPGRATLARAPIAANELSGSVRECWVLLKICALDGRVVEGGGSWTPAVRNLWSGLDVSPGPHRFRVEAGDVCEGESRGGTYAANALAAGVVGVVSAATYDAKCPPMVLEFDAQPGRTYYVEPIDGAAPHAPWIKIKE